MWIEVNNMCTCLGGTASVCRQQTKSIIGHKVILEVTKVIHNAWLRIFDVIQ